MSADWTAFDVTVLAFAFVVVGVIVMRTPGIDRCLGITYRLTTGCWVWPNCDLYDFWAVWKLPMATEPEVMSRDEPTDTQAATFEFPGSVSRTDSCVPGAVAGTLAGALSAALDDDDDAEWGALRVVDADECGDLALVLVDALGESRRELGAACVVEDVEDVVVLSDDDCPWLFGKLADVPCALAPDDEHPDIATELATLSTARVSVRRILLSRMFSVLPRWAQRSPASPSVA